MKKTIERNLKMGIFASRWLLAPFICGAVDFALPSC